MNSKNLFWAAGASFALFASTLFASTLSSAEEGAPPEPEGYRLENYHAATPATLQGATTVDTARAFEIWSSKGAAFVDTVSRPSRPVYLPHELEWSAPARRDIPGSVWLAGVGAGDLNDAGLRYLEAGLARVTSGDKTKPVLIYCRSNCWASWNAAKRALSLGYEQVIWYPGGADGWEKAGHALEERTPEPAD
jgi:PQQ-dependent catabolism-associated CXXCW motif protein